MTGGKSLNVTQLPLSKLDFSGRMVSHTSSSKESKQNKLVQIAPRLRLSKRKNSVELIAIELREVVLR